MNPNPGTGTPHDEESDRHPPDTPVWPVHAKNAMRKPLQHEGCEVLQEVALTYRDVISFSKHLLKPWAKIIGRCLQVLVHRVSEGGGGLGM